jgi:hypothetical protein
MKLEYFQIKVLNTINIILSQKDYRIGLKTITKIKDIIENQEYIDKLIFIIIPLHILLQYEVIQQYSNIQRGNHLFLLVHQCLLPRLFPPT